MKLKITAIFLFYTFIIFSQEIKIESKYDFVYYSSINTHILEEYDCTLSFDNYQSLFKWDKIGDTSLKIDDEGNYTRSEHIKNGELNYFNKKDNLIISKNNVSIKESHYIKQDSLIINWEITDEQKNIENFKCYKAIGSYGNRVYTAWYTPDISTNFGPWKLNGLDGLIIKVSDEKNEISFTLKQIKKSTSLKILDLTGLEYISLKDYYQRVVDFPYETLSLMQSKASKNSKITISNIKYNFLEKEFEVLGRKEFKNEE